MSITQAEAVVRLDALTERGNKVFEEVRGVKQALEDLRNASGTLSPEAEAALTRAEEGMGRIDDLNVDTAPTTPTEPPVEPTPDA